MDTICAQSRIRNPAIVLTLTKESKVRVRWLPIWNKGVLELSRGALELLEPDELEAVVAHELGHLRQGFFWVLLLKAFSVLALFPNYYLTLCVNWAKREIEADKYALERTGNPQAFRQALIKISSAELWARPRTSSSKTMKKVVVWEWVKTLRDRWQELAAATRFFYGSGILGYTHPFLSERLTAASTFQEAQIAGESKREVPPKEK